MSDNQQLAFHAWLSRRGIASNYAGDGQYEEPRVQLAWEAWTTAVDEMRPRAAVEADRADHLRGVTKMIPSDAGIMEIWRPYRHFPPDWICGFAHALLSRYSSGQPAADLIRRMRNRLNVLASEDADMADQADAAALVAEADALLADQPVASAEADREKLMRAIVEAGQRAGIIRADLETASVTECLHILECLSQPAASSEPAVWVAADTLYSPHPRCVSSLAYVSQTDQARGREYVPLAIINHHAAPVAALADTRSDIQNLEASRDGYRDDARALHDALTRMVAMYEAEFDHEDTYLWRPDWLKSALARRNALDGNHDNQD